ncbi:MULTISPECIES: ABC transporter permease [Virgibacillus]|uniref:ABC transporter permease protein YtlD n=2 Tax=Virgibacillus TaxID=84406 RepID=A0ABQ2DPG9_9BACI|nr:MULTISPECIES: ABC transporter permease [Virgibacillus]EQB37249.1 sulfonate ABC transporter permease [Virgibacillus sp. CM-4]GGJ62893.1 putative ABC transporter permease protein YtlD [Virgibacillus kapii]CDQ39252.1 Putative aliphatic sulfonates transport permease protein SsuC [Virgibacillus massiliensis]
MKRNNDQQLFQAYLQHVKRENRIVYIWQISILITFILLWEVASRFYWIDPLLFSSPTTIFQVVINKLSDGSMLNHLQVTLLETIAGFLLGTIFGIVLAISLWTSKRFSSVMDPYLVIMNAMPKVALGPIIIVAMGPGYISIITMGAIISVIITALVVYSAFNEVDPNYEKVLKSLGASKGQIFKNAIFPATLPAMISTLKVNVGLSWVGVVVGEFLVSKQGLGYLIIYGFQVFDFSLVMASLVLIAIFAAIMYKIVERIEVWLIKHSTS